MALSQLPLEPGTKFQRWAAKLPRDDLKVFCGDDLKVF
jgi:hypothetical protein